jgi:RND family efflux transporter MFP subunit
MIPEGGFLQPGQTVYTIADISTIWVYADVYEYEAPWLRVGEEATMTLAYQPGVTHRGKVTYVYPYLDKKTRTIEVRMEFPNTPELDLKPDMWANVVVHSEVAREAVAVPIQAVIRTGQRDVALVALEGGRFEPREVRLGAQAGDDFEVLEGLAAGDRVVTSAQFLINSESNLQSAVRKMMGSGEPAPTPMEGPEAMEGKEMVPRPPAEEAPAPAHSGHGPE